MSNVKDHAQSDQHTYAMLKEQGRAAGLGIGSWSLIAQKMGWIHDMYYRDKRVRKNVKKGK